MDSPNTLVMFALFTPEVTAMFFVQEGHDGEVQLWYSSSANEIAAKGVGSLLDDAKLVARFVSKSYAVIVANTLNKIDEIHSFIASFKRKPETQPKVTPEPVAPQSPSEEVNYYAS